jgi:hypothetical protein
MAFFMAETPDVSCGYKAIGHSAEVLASNLLKNIEVQRRIAEITAPAVCFTSIARPAAAIPASGMSWQNNSCRGFRNAGMPRFYHDVGGSRFLAHADGEMAASTTR